MIKPVQPTWLGDGGVILWSHMNCKNHLRYFSLTYFKDSQLIWRWRITEKGQLENSTLVCRNYAIFFVLVRLSIKICSRCCLCCLLVIIKFDAFRRRIFVYNAVVSSSVPLFDARAGKGEWETKPGKATDVALNYWSCRDNLAVPRRIALSWSRTRSSDAEQIQEQPTKYCFHPEVWLLSNLSRVPGTGPTLRNAGAEGESPIRIVIIMALRCRYRRWCFHTATLPSPSFL